MSVVRWLFGSSATKKRWSNALFFSFIILSLMTPLISNDQPLLIHYNGRFYFPTLIDYTEQDFGEPLPIKADYRDPYLRTKITQNGWMVRPLISYGKNAILDQSGPFPLPPLSSSLLGTDINGHDIVAQLLYGFRLAFFFGLLVGTLALGIGIGMGLLQGYLGGISDLLLHRLMEVIACIPMLYLVMAISQRYPLNFFSLASAIIPFKWLLVARLTRSCVHQEKNKPYILHAQFLGLSRSRIVIRHLLPNIWPSIKILWPFLVLGSISTLTTLDFFGLGFPPDVVSLGRLLNEGKNHLHAPWIALPPIILLALLFGCLIFMGQSKKPSIQQPLPVEPEGTE